MLMVLVIIAIIIVALKMGWLKLKFDDTPKLKARVEKLAKDLNDAEVKNYIDFLQRLSITNHPDAWHTLRASYRLVNSSKQIAQELKEQLRITLLSKGCEL